MKKINNKYRNNNYNNQIYSLNYKFDSSSPAGKLSGTALDLIKKYNEYAKEAMSNNDYVMAEVYRQYAEHYRKIVTDINEKKAQQRTPISKETETQNTDISKPEEITANVEAENDNQTEQTLPEQETVSTSAPQEKETKKKTFTVIEISDKEESTAALPKVTKKRVYRRKNTTTTEQAASETPKTEDIIIAQGE